MRLELCRVGPRAPLERPARRNRSTGEGAGGGRRRRSDAARIEPGHDFGQGIEKLPGGRVLRRLEIRVHLVIGRVQLFARRMVAPRRDCRRDVRVDRFLPVADARESVRWHVQGVRRGRRDFRVSPRGVERFGRQGRHVVAVNDVVREARMLRLGREELLEDCARLQAARVGFVGWLLGRAQRQGVEDRRFGILGESVGDAGHRIAIRQDSRVLIHGVRIGEQLRGGIDVRAFAIGLRADGFCSVEGFTALLHLSGGPLADAERVAPSAHADAPIRDPAARVGRRRLVERRDRAGELERVQQCHRVIECRLRRLAARRREMDRAELFGRSGAVLVLLRTGRRSETHGSDRRTNGVGETHWVHAGSLHRSGAAKALNVSRGGA